MERYGNLNGDSGVTRFEIGPQDIKVEFRDGSVYLYNEQRPGMRNVEEMVRLARAGRGLNSYINQVVKKNYAAKPR